MNSSVFHKFNKTPFCGFRTWVTLVRSNEYIQQSSCGFQCAAVPLRFMILSECLSTLGSWVLEEDLRFSWPISIMLSVNRTGCILWFHLTGRNSTSIITNSLSKQPLSILPALEEHFGLIMFIYLFISCILGNSLIARSELAIFRWWCHCFIRRINNSIDIKLALGKNICKGQTGKYIKYCLHLFNSSGSCRQQTSNL